MDRRQTLHEEWKRRRTRYEPSVLADVIAAAQSSTDRPDSQIATAARLIGLPEDQVRQAVLQAATQSHRLGTSSGLGHQHDANCAHRAKRFSHTVEIEMPQDLGSCSARKERARRTLRRSLA